MDRIILIFIVNGEDVAVENSPEDSLDSARDKALTSSHNTGRPLNEWEIRNEKGELLNPKDLISTIGATNGDKFFLTLEVGFGGDPFLLLTDYDKCFYEVRTTEGDFVLCWPNAGIFHEINVEDNRSWEVGKIEARITEKHPTDEL